jgi:hypothetical protein
MVVAALQVLQAILAVVDRDPVEPGGEFRVTAKAVDRLEDGDEDLLGHILGLLRRAQHAEDHLVDLHLVQLEDLGEGSLVALLEPPD